MTFVIFIINATINIFAFIVSVNVVFNFDISAYVILEVV